MDGCVPVRCCQESRIFAKKKRGRAGFGASKVDSDAFLFPIAVASGIWAIAAPKFDWAVGLGFFAAFFCFGQGALGGGR